MLSDSDVLTITALAEQTAVLRMGGNSTVAQVEFKERHYAVKDYSARDDGEQRLIQEFSALEFLHPELPDRFAEPLGIGPDGVRAVYSWIEGVRPPIDTQTVTHMLDIANELHHLSKSVKPGQVKPATDQVLNSSDIAGQLNKRFEALSASPGPVADYIKAQIDSIIRNLGNDRNEAGQAVPTLSPSDFGAHNLIWDEQSGRMRCIDLEFFGWDDAHKLTCDSLLHPLADWSIDCADAFLAGAVETYHLDQDRLKWLWPLLNLKWAAITLSRAERNLQAQDQELANRAMQRAKIYVARASREPDSLSDIVQQVASKRGSS
jgi:hypothetical protein